MALKPPAPRGYPLHEGSPPEDLVNIWKWNFCLTYICTIMNMFLFRTYNYVIFRFNLCTDIYRLWISPLNYKITIGVQQIVYKAISPKDKN